MQKRGSSERFNLNYLYCINTLSMLSDLPRDLAEDVLLKVPMNSVRAVRSVCKNWNTLSKCLSFKKKSLAQGKAAAKEESEYMMVMVISGQVYLMSANLHRIQRNLDPSIKNQGKLVRLIDSSDRFYISNVYHCDGLLLCTMKESTRFVVWNPYLCQNRWFNCQPIRDLCMYAIGYDNSKLFRSYKILRFHSFSYFELYYINSRNVEVRMIEGKYLFDWMIFSDDLGVSLKGNTYWIARERDARFKCFLLCFDFRTERFAPSLDLPFQSFVDDIVTLSSVRDEQLAVLFRRNSTSNMEIWITTKIEPKVVLWRKLFIALVMEPLSSYQFRVTGKFFVDEEKKVAVVFGCEKTGKVGSYIIGENGYFKEVDFKEPLYQLSCPSMCSYVPSLVQIKDGKRKRTKVLNHKVAKAKVTKTDY